MCHDGTVRDLIFMQDVTTRTSLLVSGGAGDCKICITDCETGTLLRSMAGHTGNSISVLPVSNKWRTLLNVIFCMECCVW
jgi:hypothetical protein